MRKDDCFLLGYVIKPHGLKGEVSVYLDTDYPEEYSEMESVFLEVNQRLVPFFISGISLSGDRAVIRFEDVNSFEQARDLKGCALYLPEDQLPETGEDQFYFHEIIGYVLIDETLGRIGPVTMVYASGKQDLLAVDYRDKEVLVPVMDEIISKVNRDSREILVRLPDGLLDI